MSADLAQSHALPVTATSPVQALAAGLLAGRDLAEQMRVERVERDRRRMAEALQEATVRVPSPRLG